MKDCQEINRLWWIMPKPLERKVSFGLEMNHIFIQARHLHLYQVDLENERKACGGEQYKDDNHQQSAKSMSWEIRHHQERRQYADVAEQDGV